MSSRITSQMVADYLFMSTRQVDRITLACRGVTLKQLINKLKTKKAEEYILQAEQSLSDIGLRLGFSDASSFSHFYKRFTGRSPGKYKEKAGLGDSAFSQE